MKLKNRIIILVVTFSVLLTISYFFEGIDIFGKFWFSSGLLLIILLTLVDQPFFTKDSNIFVNSITALISLLAILNESNEFIYFFFLTITIYLTLSSLVLMFIRKDTLRNESYLIQFISRLNRVIGKPNVIFSAFFIWGIIKEYNINSNEFNVLFSFWIVFILIYSPNFEYLIEQIFKNKDLSKMNGIGVILGVHSQNIYLVKVEEKNASIDVFDFVAMKYSVDNNIHCGIVIEIMYLNKEQWLKVFTDNEFYISNFYNKKQDLKNDVVYKIREVTNNNILNNFVGIVTDGSVINKINFIYNSRVKVNEGDLLEILIRNDIRVIYQIIEGNTKIKQLSDKNEAGLIIGEAIQLGVWDKDKYRFEKFGWVPKVNTAIKTVQDLEEYNITKKEELEIGKLPGTNYPVILDKEIAITHHTAIIGVTGTGKSVFSRKLIKEYLKDDDVKVVCIDFTGEYIDKLGCLNPTKIINETDSIEIFNKLKEIEKLKNEKYGKDIAKIVELRNEIISSMKKSIDKFIGSNVNKLTILELPEISNTSIIMNYTQLFFNSLFNYVKDNKGKRICLVLEEAHTIVPEWNSIATTDNATKTLVNSIAQIALQGRKYNIGLLVIAQRTANVSKTILTQCNTVIAFQVFDNTSIDYLVNYFGTDTANSLTNLKFRHAIAAGKAFKSNVPMIFEVPLIEEN